MTAADEQDRAQVEKLAEAVQEITGKNVELAYGDQGYTGESAAQAAEKHGVRLEVVKHTEAKRGFVLLPRRWVVERSFAWAARFRRLARDYERLSQTCGLSLLGLCHPHARKFGQIAHAKFITGSNPNVDVVIGGLHIKLHLRGLEARRRAHESV